MAVYSKAYQTVTAGRVREDEAIAFFGQNKVAGPARVFSINNLSAAKAALVVDFLQFSGVGKPGNVADLVTGFVSDNITNAPYESAAIGS